MMCECTGCTRLLRQSALIAVLTAAACTTDAPPEHADDAGEVSPSTFAVRLDSESSDLDLFEVAEDDDGIRIQTGPAGIAYRPDEAVRAGDFSLEATFTQFEAPVGYREAFGIFVGGLALQEPDHEYTYLLVRTTGDYLIKRRIGEITETLVDWTPHEAVRTVDAEGDEPVNVLGIVVSDGEARFVVNGVTVESIPTGRARPYGVVGTRVNHRLDVRVDGWSLLTEVRDS